MSEFRGVEVECGPINDEVMPIKCICGYGSNPGSTWDFIISIDKDDLDECPNCGRKYYFENRVKVMMMEPE